MSATPSHGGIPGLLRDFGTYCWRLIPANPIVVRVVAAGGRRRQHFWIRLLYIAVLAIILIVGVSGLGSGAQSLAELAKSSSRLFMIISVVQLGLMSFIAPIFTAGAITQERDGATFDILLTTPMTNAQIVLGSLLGRLFFVLALLVAGLPLFGIAMIYGGITSGEVFLSGALAACTGLVTGAVAITISMLRLGTRRILIVYFLAIAVYLLTVFALGWNSATALAEAPPSPSFAGVRMSWLAPFHPFLALFVVTGQTPAPAPSLVAHYGAPWSWLLAYPQYGFMVITTIGSTALILLSLLFVRRGQRDTGAPTWTKVLGLLNRGGERLRTPRKVWSNPIAWREAATAGSAAGNTLMRWAFMAGGLLLGLILLIMYHQGGIASTAGGQRDPLDMREWLIVTTWIEFVIILVVVVNTAAGALTREKESQTMEILMTTPLTSFYIISGMLQGLVRFTLPLICVPAGTLALFAIGDLLAGTPAATIHLEAILIAPILMTAYVALAAVIGLHASLIARTTIQAAMLSTAIVLAGTGLLWACGLAFSRASAPVGMVVLPWLPLPALAAILDPSRLLTASALSTPRDALTARIGLAVFALVATAAYIGISYAVCRYMVRNFNRIMRRQAR